MNADYRWYWAAGLAALVAALYFLSPILSPFLIGMLLAYLGDPLADRLERLGLSRVMAVLVVFALGTGVLILCIGILVPLLGNQISWLRDQIPAMIDWVNHTALPWIESRTGVSTDDFRLDTVRETIPNAQLTPVATGDASGTKIAVEGADIAIAAGAAGIELLSSELRAASRSLKVAVDLNAVPPLGIGGVEVTDKAVDHDGVICYGAIGVGGTKMKIHKAAIKKLFETNDQVLDAEEIFEIGRQLEAEVE